jgi:hypothetical protein
MSSNDDPEYLAFLFGEDKQCPITPIRQGSKYADDGDSWTNYWIFPRLTEKQIEEVIDRLDIRRTAGRPGQIFTSSPSFRHTSNRTIITQYGGYDI